ncbi:similar to Saccharomyces cerevisiae YKL092C BUD2 GTPase activating factor for Rsr1p/Bud1p required for both axial and bipolar budding patterns [Maudiozyma saulgeensis]|uniref:Similar to Saccharomyces cerevisiae YKL092C BUD2 GTPase activating factor for Rsr1p/Bud1p required for both axial and bipolar budding patterns n=1 Tax=Maudiozyma saulgeensis TaxID=1789683 RepID=A0A1X7QZM0_9SACH|nr:similar to Saccharomyces cerevisiae YKL092C BUD2 GTPase activating factor for Rsr1p/Bud1p required for both axial and bipolar budding patterns [Kazachstania saulgeensis]
MSVNHGLDLESVTMDDYTKRIESLGGTFKGEVRWTTNIKLNDWKTHFLEITKTGSLVHSVDKNHMTLSQGNKLSSLSLDDMSDGIQEKNKHPVLRNLSGCKLRILKNINGRTRVLKNIIKVSENSNTTENSSAIYLNVASETKLLDLFCSLTWWSALKPKGIFDKMTLVKKQEDINNKSSKTVLFITSDVNVFGPISENVILETNTIKTPEMFVHYGSKDECSYGWFQATIKLFSNGEVEVLNSTNDHSLFSINVKNLIRSEIRLLDYSLFQDENLLFLGILPQLRKQLNLFDNGEGTIFFNLVDGKPLDSLTFNFKNSKTQRDDWLIALKSFAILEILSLNGSDRSNKMTVSNKFKLTILEADFQTLDLTANDRDIYLHAEIWIWGRMWARTTSIKNENSPFWRDEFSLDEIVSIDQLEIRLIQEITEKDNIKPLRYEVLGTFKLSQDEITSNQYQKESRVLVFAEDHQHFQVATLCFKVEHKLEFILPSINFTKFQTVLSSVPLNEVTRLIYDNVDELTRGGKLDTLSSITLELFQSTGKEDVWFQTLMERELSDIDSVVLRNLNNNHSSGHIFSTLFRGNSLLTKSTELYFFEVGKEYISLVMTPILREIIESNESCEIDPSKINLPHDEKEIVLEANYNRLIGWVSRLWQLLYKTSKDLPLGIRSHLKNFRRELEKFCLKDNEEATLNCISGFLFLRFFCPVILNPKLFNVTFDHLNNTNRRSLTLICKILLNLSTLKKFGEKEPFMVKVNDFINENCDNLKDYIDKITQKKIDFTTTVLNLSETTKSRLKDVTFNQEELKELPVNPFRLDKGLRETEFIKILNSLNKTMVIKPLNNPTNDKIQDSTKDIKNSNPVAIGELEFEKLTENNAEIFGDEFMQYLEVENEDSNERNANGDMVSHADSKNEIIGSATSLTNKNDIMMAQLLQETSLLCFKQERIIRTLSDYEYPLDDMYNNSTYAKRLAKSIFSTNKRKILIDLTNGLLQPNNEYIQMFAGSNKETKCNPNIFYLDSKDSKYSSDEEEEEEEDDEEEIEINGNDFYMGNTNSSSTRTLSKFANLIKGGSFNENKDDSERISPSKLSRWFKKK